MATSQWAREMESAHVRNSKGQGPPWIIVERNVKMIVRYGFNVDQAY